MNILIGIINMPACQPATWWQWPAALLLGLAIVALATGIKPLPRMSAAERIIRKKTNHKGDKSVESVKSVYKI